jgi:hypothetical protein
MMILGGEAWLKETDSDVGVFDGDEDFGAVPGRFDVDAARGIVQEELA